MDTNNIYSKNLYKANELIFAKYTVDSILENRIMALVLLAIQNNDYTESENNNLIISFSVKSLLEYCNVKGNKYMQLIDELKESIQSRWIGFTDYENKTFCYKAMFVGASLHNGIITLSVNGELRKYLINITSRGNYTSLSLLSLMSLKSSYSIRLYEILRKSCFANSKKGSFTCQLDVTELKLMLGVYKVDKKVRRELERGLNTDYESIEEYYKENYYSSFRRFNEKILMKATSEINEKSDIEVSYEQVKHNKGGKTFSLLFTCKLKKDKKSEDDVVRKIESVSLQAARDLFAELRLSDRDCEMICKASGYSVSKLTEVKKVFDKNKGTIESPVAWIISAIKNNYTVSDVKPVTKSNAFNNFEQRQYDYDELMQDLING